jgi:hypothetical protein
MMVQEWIDTGPHIQSYRAMTVLDTVCYVVLSIAVEAEEITETLAASGGIDVASNSRRRSFVHSSDLDVFELASAIAKALTFSPTFGIDIIRDWKTRKLYVLELNSGFPTWHLSSRAAKKHERDIGTFSLAERYRQFNALEQISDALARATILLAD